MHQAGQRGSIFEKYQDAQGTTQFGWLDATIERVHANGMLTVQTSQGAFFVDDKEFVV